MKSKKMNKSELKVKLQCLFNTIDFDSQQTDRALIYNEIYNDKNFLIWREKWESRLNLNNNNKEKFLKLMRSVNPLVIPRNHKVEEALEAANNDDFNPIKNLIDVLQDPYKDNKKNIGYQSPSPDTITKYQTFCGT